MNRPLNTLCTFLIILFCAQPALSQQESEQMSIRSIFADFGNLPSRLLDVEADHGYPHEYLTKKSSILFQQESGDIKAIIDHLVRIKIYTDEPLEIASAALVGIPVYESDNLEELRNLEGITYLPDGSTVSLPEDQISRSELNSRYSITEFEMPEAGPGAVLEYKYSIHRRYIEELPDFYFAHRVPVREASVTLQNERFLRYDVVTEHVDFDITYTREEIDTSSVPLVFSYSRPEPILIENWRAVDIPPVDQKAYVSSIDDIRGKVKFMISEFGIPRQPLENSWELVAAQMRKNASPEEVLADHPGLLERGKTIAADFEDSESAQDSIYHLVNERVQFNGMNAVFADEGLEHVLTPEPANQAEINMTLLAMLRGAGIESHPIYISGRDYGRINRSFPSVYQFNRMLVYSRINGESHIMDASFRNSEPGLIPVDSFNEQGFLLRSESYDWIDISPDKSLFNLNIHLDLRLSKSGSLDGRLEAELSGYPAQQLLSDIETGTTVQQAASSMFLDMYSEVEIEDADVTPTAGVSRDLTAAIDFTIENYATSFNDGLEFRPMVVGYLFQNPFEATSRQVPITLDAPEKLFITYNVTLPDGYSIDDMGEQLNTRLSGAELSETYSVSGSSLQYSFEIDISRKVFPADMYAQLRRLYKRWVDLSNSTWFIEKQQP